MENFDKKLGEYRMLKKCKYIPRLENERVILRELTEAGTEEIRVFLD